jgi:hypothetical protein
VAVERKNALLLGERARSLGRIERNREAHAIPQPCTSRSATTSWAFRARCWPLDARDWAAFELFGAG